MKKLKNISLFKITVFLIINLYIRNIYVLIVSLVLIIIENYINGLVSIVLLSLILLNLFSIDFITIGIVEEKLDNYAVIDKVLYKVKVYNHNELNVGDVISFKYSSNKINEESDLKYNYRFNYSKEIEVKYNIVTRYKTKIKIESFDEITKANINRIVLNKNDINVDLDYIGYGFAFYYLLNLIKKKDIRISIAIFVLYLLFFEFNIKLYLIIIEYLITIFNIKKKNRIFVKIILTLLINPYLLINNIFVISLVYSVYFNSRFYKDRYILSLIQSLFFYEVKLLSSFFYKYVIYSKICLFIFSIIVIIVPNLSSTYLQIISKYSQLFNIFDISVRGKIYYIYILIIYVLGKLIINHNQIFKISILCLILLTINNPLAHISYIDVGQGDASLIHDSFNRKNIIIDTGSKYNYSKLRKYLYKEGIYTIDCLIITHSDEDHSGNIDNLKKNFKIKEILTIGRNLETNNFKLKYINLGVFDNDNDNSLVYLVSSNNTQFLFTGDISKNVENILINKFNISNIDVLKISHHGSKSASSDYFIGNLKPKVAIISTNGKYNHPSNEVINTLDSFLVDTYITKSSGNICFYIFKLFNILITDNNEFVII